MSLKKKKIFLGKSESPVHSKSSTPFTFTGKSNENFAVKIAKAKEKSFLWLSCQVVLVYFGVFLGCWWRRWGAEQVWFVARHHCTSPENLCHTFPQCFTQSEWLGGQDGWGMEAGQPDTEAETHLKQRGLSLQPQRKCVLLVIHSGQQTSAARLCFSWWFSLFLLCRKFYNSTVIPV